MGERSSCAASATKRRWACMACSTRASKRLMASTKGRISDGSPCCATACNPVSLRASTSRAKAATGLSMRCTIHTVSTTSKGTSNSKGSTVNMALSRAISLRRLVSCSTAKRSPLGRLCTNMR